MPQSPGWAGSRSSTRNSDPEQSYIQEIMPAKLRLAVEYVQHASFWRDLAIVWSTVRVLWQREVP